MATFLRSTRSLPARGRQPIHVAVGAILAGFFLALHGGAHTLAFFVQWEITHSEDLTYHTTLLGGHIDIGDVGIRIEGLLWLVAALGFVVVGLRLAGLRRIETLPLAAVTIFSLALCVLGLPEASVGVVIDAAILAVLILVWAVWTGRAP